MQDEIIRAFIAMPVPENTRMKLEAEADRLIGGINSRLVKKTNFSNLHITLHFIGNVQNSDIPVLIKILECSKMRLPFTISIGGPGYFSKRREAAVLWFAAECTSGDIGIIHKNIGTSLRNKGFNTGSADFRPHLTAAYIRPGLDMEILEKNIDGFLFRDSLSFTVSEINLYRSILLPSGARHEVIFTRKPE